MNVRLIALLIIAAVSTIGCQRKAPVEPNARTEIKCYSGAFNTYTGIAHGAIIRFDDHYQFTDSDKQDLEVSGSCLLTKLPPAGY